VVVSRHPGIQKTRGRQNPSQVEEWQKPEAGRHQNPVVAGGGGRWDSRQDRQAVVAPSLENGRWQNDCTQSQAEVKCNGRHHETQEWWQVNLKWQVQAVPQEVHAGRRHPA